MDCGITSVSFAAAECNVRAASAKPIDRPVILDGSPSSLSVTATDWNIVAQTHELIGTELFETSKHGHMTRLPCLPHTPWIRSRSTRSSTITVTNAFPWQ